ncbi:MAG: hypothetical protein ACRD26_24855 [Vicinamibacterales bacterium]
MRRTWLALAGMVLIGVHAPEAQKAPMTPVAPTATLRRADPLTLPGGVDSNSPLVWDREDGRSGLYVLTSINGRPSRATGEYLTLLDQPRSVEIEPWPGGGVWMEAIVRDYDAWYGFYHNENRAPGCGGRNLTYPRIGAARSTDFGATWTNLGIILDLPPETFACSTSNRYFVGGVGDMSVLLDRRHRDFYIYFSQYARDRGQQGIGVARLAWADRDAPIGKLSVWSGGVWLPAALIEDDAGSRWVYPKATPLVRPSKPWHDSDRAVDAFWGPSIHWNAWLGQYVMLLNRASDEAFGQEGIYISFSPRLGDPLSWSAPLRILAGGRWYPQVAGIEVGRGTDAWAGRIARFFMAGRSDYVIEFGR